MRLESEETVAHYTMGSGLEAMRRDSASSFYHYNHLGTTLALTGADEAVSDTYRHDAWGVLLESTGSTVNPHTYVGRERYYRMPNAAMYHLGFRDYAQGVGRFMTVDPAQGECHHHGRWRSHQEQESVELFTRGGLAEPVQDPMNHASYRYVENRAALGVDPEGLWVWLPGALCVAGILVCGNELMGQFIWCSHFCDKYNPWPMPPREKFNKSDPIGGFYWECLTPEEEKGLRHLDECMRGCMSEEDQRLVVEKLAGACGLTLIGCGAVFFI